MFITAPNRFFVSDKLCGSGAFACNPVHPFSKILRAPTNGRRSSSFKASLISNPDAFEVGKFIGSYGYMNITSYSSVQSGGPSSKGLFVDLDSGYSSEDVEQLKVQDVGEGQVKIRLYEGRVALGPLRGARVIFKVYPGNRAGGAEADMMAANELSAHAYLQSDRKSICPNIQILLGGFETKTGEQWLAFRNDGKYSAADYAKATSEALTRDPAQGENKFWNPFDLDQTFKRRHLFIIKLLRGAMNGLAYMHERGRLHQSVGPASVVIKRVQDGGFFTSSMFTDSTIVEKDAAYLVPRLRDLAFSVDTCNSPLEAVTGAFSEGLWRRATAAGAFTTAEKKAFGIADDIYEAGLLFAYLAFVPFCEAGVVDALSLQRLFESTFKLDLVAAREYCEADDRLSEAVRFLDLGGGAGWELLQAMLNPDFRQRPVTQTVLKHGFLTDKTIGG